MGLSDSLPGRSRGYVFPRRVGCFRFHPTGPPRLLGWSFHARCPQPPRKVRIAAYACCFAIGLVWLHPSRADWPPSFSYRGRIGFTCVTARVFASQVRQPHCWNSRSLGYVLNRQFTRWTPFSSQDQPGLSWRTRAAGGSV